MNSPAKRTGSGLPFVFVNMAMTADGKIATANRAVHSFGSARDREHLYELRATADAVMAGAATINAAPVSLGPGAAKFRRRRLKRGLAEYPLRIIVSGSGSLDPGAEIFRHQFSPIIILTTRRIARAKLEQLRALADEVKICGRTQIDFGLALRWLRKTWNVKRLLCEGGGDLNDSLFRADLVDEINLTICPKIFGGRRAPTIAGGQGFEKLRQAGRFKLQSAHSFEGELFTAFSRAQDSLVSPI